MSIRRAELADAKAIAVVHVAAWRVAYRGLLPDDVLERLSVDDSEARWRERLAEPWGHVLVAEQGGDVVGFAACGISRDEDVDPEQVGELYVIYVHPEHWRQGIGASLLEEALACLQADGFEGAILWVLDGNQQARRFYESAGFRADGATRTKCRTDGTKMPIVRYRRCFVQTVTLYRPTGPEEMALVEKSGYKAWPPRLPEQPIFYPVTNKEYAVQIARDWNVRASGKGFVTRFQVRAEFVAQFPVQRVGGMQHTEWWVPAERLEELNANIVGTIEVLYEFGT